MNSKFILFIVFIIVNFGALAIGSLLMNNGSSSEWYYSLNKAPWTPQGWVFGVAWFSIMGCFSLYLTKLVGHFEMPNKHIIGVFSLQWFLNVFWNYFFFNKHQTVIGLIMIISLWLVVGYFTFKYLKPLQWYTLLIAPYLIWLTIASSLNAYIVIYN